MIGGLGGFGTGVILTAVLIPTGLVIGSITIPGSFCARWLTTRMSAHLHIVVIEGMLLIAALWLIVTAWRISPATAS